MAFEMKWYLLIGIWACVLAGCTSGEDSAREPATTATDTTEAVQIAGAREVTPAPFQRPRCDDVPFQTELWFQDVGLLVQLIPVEGGARLEVRDTACRRMRSQTLQGVRAADYPCYLADVSYNQASKLVAVRDFDVVWVYDVMADRLFGPLEPRFRLPRQWADAGSGRILRLELWEYYLTGWAQDLGAFVFDLSQDVPRPVLAEAEYRLPNEMVRSLFLLPADEAGNRQAILPWYDYEGAAFRIHPLFERPLPLEPLTDETMRTQRYVRLSAKDAQGQTRTWTVDMLMGTIVEGAQ